MEETKEKTISVLIDRRHRDRLMTIKNKGLYKSVAKVLSDLLDNYPELIKNGN